VVNLAGTFLLTVAFFMNKDGHLERAKRLGIITINIYLFSVSYVEGLRSGQYLLFFPLLLALIFVIDLKRNLNEVIIYSVMTLMTTAMIFILAPYQNTLQKIPQDLYSSLFSTNLAIALLLTTVFAYLILKTLENQFAENATQCAATAEAITQALNQATRYKVALQRLEEKRTVLESMIADTQGRLESLQNAR